MIALFCLSGLQIKAQDDELKKKAAEKAALKNIKDTGWIKGGFFSTNISNTTFSNWSQGGTNNTGLISNANLFAILFKLSYEIFSFLNVNAIFSW